MKIKTLLTLSLLVVLGLSSCSINQDSSYINEQYKTYLRNQNINKDGKIKNIILFIGDGMGPNHVSAGEIYKGEQFVFSNNDDPSWTFHGYSNTDSLTSLGFTLDETKSLLRPEENPSLYDDMPSPYGNSLSSGSITCYTDSAAGGTALSTGIKVTNSRIAKDIFGNDLTSILDIAHAFNKKTGVVTTDNLAGATPASFLANAYERHLYDDIIKSTATSNADLIIAQTLSNWEDNKSTYEDLYKTNGFDNIAYSLEELNIDSNRELCLLPAILPFGDRTPTLSELTMYALDSLDNENGFFLMVEGSNIDKQSHSNQTVAMLNELLGFEEAVKQAYMWAKGRDDTLIIVTADHETGALYYDRDNTSKETITQDISWLSYNHSRTRVSVDVYGDISEFISLYSSSFSLLEGLPYIDNTDVFKLAASYL